MHGPEHTADVAVLGNGPVGQTAALLLARWGMSVLLLDQRPARDEIGSKAICQQRDVLDIWAQIGAGQRIAAEGVTWSTARTFYRDQELFSYPIHDPGESLFPPFVNISQCRTEQILDELIDQTAPIDVRWNHEVTELVPDANGVRIRCVTAEGQFDVRVPYALACTGARTGWLHAALGITFDGKSFDDRFLICDIRAELTGWRAERRFYFDPSWNPGRQVLVHPCPDSTFRIDWQVPADYDLASERRDGGLDRRIRAIIGDLPYEIVWSTVYRFHSRLASQLRAGRVLLAGDCAHLYAPFGARGLNSGVADAENAAWKLAFVLQGWGAPELLDSYHLERHAAARENLAITTATMDFLVPHNETQREYRRSILDQARTDASVHEKVDSGRLSEPFWYADSPLNTPNPRRPRPDRPPRGRACAPGPGVLVPDMPLHATSGLPASRLRELARNGILLLAADGVALPLPPATLSSLTPAPIRVLGMTELTPDGSLADCLTAEPGELWIIRPDGYIAAVLRQPELPELHAALYRLTGMHDRVVAGLPN
ncbi:pentachlorophenol monooxygenase/3-(3-hydroxy-phenyl)propionate hydroxylase [Tamaricihabitans halophyticus]|uniref:Pentachlorophenol monooxygenase/3-(3-hydroxy-phenyl)propionate hydroxylase n=1 Tax=Tamaricihabitans halophyticus TaxID=1262583 RepID=A0A4R2QX56_9PSEU|nr:FAD-dependent monooxygenase [Tamaricihabitans halophyticus]TCP53558.1 pentachlorophenol monooxygenase/3-(3-hydroxy-phenyl)propionate hydroxylase [Tamaricihabitans halophyticus]